ncbi:hypothetical protein KCU85_g489, partial [Aureobasidium melanogenum]
MTNMTCRRQDVRIEVEADPYHPWVYRSVSFRWRHCSQSSHCCASQHLGCDRSVDFACETGCTFLGSFSITSRANQLCLLRLDTQHVTSVVLNELCVLFSIRYFENEDIRPLNADLRAPIFPLSSTLMELPEEAGRILEEAHGLAARLRGAASPERGAGAGVGGSSSISTSSEGTLRGEAAGGAKPGFLIFDPGAASPDLRPGFTPGLLQV